MLWQAWIVDALHFRFIRQIRGEFHSIRIVGVHANRQSLDATQDEPRIEWRKDRARRVLNELKTLGVVRMLEDHDAADTVAMTVEVFRGAVDHDIRAEF